MSLIVADLSGHYAETGKYVPWVMINELLVNWAHEEKSFIHDSKKFKMHPEVNTCCLYLYLNWLNY